MSGRIENIEMAGMPPAMPAQVKMNWGPLMNGLSMAVLAVWVYTLLSSNAQLQKRLDDRDAIDRQQRAELIAVMTEIKQYMQDQKYQNTLQSIRNK